MLRSLVGSEMCIRDSGEGLWKGEFENTKIFYIEVPESEAIATSVLLKHIADKYRKAFRQESVLVSEVSTQTTFV